jgi:hypothetical protein
MCVRWFKRRPTANGQWERVSREVAAARVRRVEATAASADLVAAVSKALFRADPIGINFGTNKDEYDAEAETIVIGLPSRSGPQDVQLLAHECFVQWFDAQLAGPPARYASVAEEIWDLWRRHEEQRSSDT